MCAEKFLKHREMSAHRLCTRCRAYSIARVAERPCLALCIGPSSEPFDSSISCFERVRVRKVCGDVPHTQGTSAHRLRTRSRAYSMARVAERPSFSPISRHALGHRRGRSTASSAALRAFVCAKCVETYPTHKGTSVHRLRTRSRAYSMARVAERPWFALSLGMHWAIVGGRSTAPSAALRAFVCTKCVETFLTHRGTFCAHHFARGTQNVW